jgi:predicted nucleic acid-binding protein
MELVVDANILMSALIASDGKTRELIFSPRFELFAPEFLFEEIEAHGTTICKKSKLNPATLQLAMTILTSRIQVIPKEDFLSSVLLAEKLSPDPKDTIYLALALWRRCALWTNDRALKQQTEVRVFSTHELLRNH